MYGAFHSYARALYAELIPHREGARWYALYSITDKVRACWSLITGRRLILLNQSSSFVGPLVVGLIADTTGNIRYAFLFLVLVVWAAVPVLLAVDVEAGRADAQAYVAGEGCGG